MYPANNWCFWWLCIPTAGTPAVSDESMSAWMECLYQQPWPKDTTGVEVTLDVIDANGNYRNIAASTTDVIAGVYSFMWEHEIPGKYTVIATFAVSKSYYDSYAETAFGIEEAPAVPPPAEDIAVDFTPMYLTVIGIGIAIIVAIAIVGLLLRKR